MNISIRPPIHVFESHINQLWEIVTVYDYFTTQISTDPEDNHNMGEARYLPLFVTADVSTDVSSKANHTILHLPAENVFQIVNSVLHSAAAETEEDEDFENRWSLIPHTSQTTADKPSIAPVEDFTTDFTNASLKKLQTFVAERCGENGLGCEEGGVYMDWLANDAFGVIDARTAEDETILFCAKESVDAIQEAEVRLAWNKGMNSPYQ